MTVRDRSFVFTPQDHDYLATQAGQRYFLQRVGTVHLFTFAFAKESAFQVGYTKVSDHGLALDISELFMIVVEYAMEAISHAGTVIGVLAKDGVVLAAEKKVTGKLLDLSGTKEGGYGGSGEKIFLLNSYVPLLL